VPRNEQRAKRTLRDLPSHGKKHGTEQTSMAGAEGERGPISKEPGFRKDLPVSCFVSERKKRKKLRKKKGRGKGYSYQTRVSVDWLRASWPADSIRRGRLRKPQTAGAARGHQKKKEKKTAATTPNRARRQRRQRTQSKLAERLKTRIESVVERRTLEEKRRGRDREKEEERQYSNKPARPRA